MERSGRRHRRRTLDEPFRPHHLSDDGGRVPKFSSTALTISGNESFGSSCARQRRRRQQRRRRHRRRFVCLSLGRASSRSDLYFCQLFSYGRVLKELFELAIVSFASVDICEQFFCIFAELLKESSSSSSLDLLLQLLYCDRFFSFHTL